MFFRTSARLPQERFQLNWRQVQDLGLPQHVFGIFEKRGFLLSLAVKKQHSWTSNISVFTTNHTTSMSVVWVWS
jgi:hypothetical protein